MPLPSTRHAVVGSPSTTLVAANVTGFPAASPLGGAVPDAWTARGISTSGCCGVLDPEPGGSADPPAGGVDPSVLPEPKSTSPSPRPGTTYEAPTRRRPTEAVTSAATACPVPGERRPRAMPSTTTPTRRASSGRTTAIRGGSSVAPPNPSTPRPETSQYGPRVGRDAARARTPPSRDG